MCGKHATTPGLLFNHFNSVSTYSSLVLDLMQPAHSFSHHRVEFDLHDFNPQGLSVSTSSRLVFLAFDCVSETLIY
jgi:hypothetical protein